VGVAAGVLPQLFLLGCLIYGLVRAHTNANRSDLMQLVFAPNSDTITAATQFVVLGALQQWLGDLIQVDEVQVDSEDATVTVTVQYVVRRTQQQQVARFTRGGTP